ncbi:hypothetical protein [Micromonospora sp. NPDC005413]|uniref:hypothetical protein n=1 Tax=Micromonospora sp. NPDC005413 TaxID=3154563 RepID=UPI0033A1166A
MRARAGWVAMVAAREVEGSNLRPVPLVDPPGTAAVAELLDPDAEATRQRPD